MDDDIIDVTITDFMFKKYRKSALAKAIQLDYPFYVYTLEGRMKGHAGDYLCEGFVGERWPIQKKIFEDTYVLEEDSCTS